MNWQPHGCQLYSRSMSNSNHLSRFAGYQVRVTAEQDWSSAELDDLFRAVDLLANVMHGMENFTRCVGNVVIERADTGTNLGLAWHDRIRLSRAARFSTWTVVHELAHVWDARNKWGLSMALQKYTGGFTSRVMSSLKRILLPRAWDAQPAGHGNRPGFYGRKPGCNAYGYFYGDKPSGSNWRFNRREDFAESLVMYCGWGRENDLSRTAHGRIERYRLANGEKDPLHGISDNWADYARYFYPENGDYTKTKRWQFIDILIQTHPVNQDSL
jgi:hypothetical protein